ncbi:hypothetical protein [Actinoplanes couchii]|uniref:hypothetical protein n=1 Tax=Actinoplanes couchii TaxID=403638 RepID=UPI001941E0DC|nr:hypothetical protein [Actinoplanes couchii]MDR6324669.1 hypothetical protein [Actinoplanes couchii]
MGTWLATIRLPGAVRYADYSTVVEAVCTPLYPSMEFAYDRNRACGERLPDFPERPLAPIDELILVTIEREPYGEPWHALYCPNRQRIVGPLSDHYRYRLQEEYDLINGHLCRYAGPATVCGRVTDGEPLGLLFPTWPGGPDTSDAPPAPDLFARWNDPDLCRRCFLTWSTQPEENPEGAADVPGPVQRRRWWRFGH